MSSYWQDLAGILWMLAFTFLVFCLFQFGDFLANAIDAERLLLEGW